MLQFIKLIEIRKYFDEEITNYNDAIRCILNKESIDKKRVNILMAHQFVTYDGQNPEICDSETINIGTIDNVDASLFFDFDYVALGHIHGPQRIGKDSIRYAGTMLKYSFSESQHNKSVVVIDITDNKLSYELLPLKPMRDLREIKGPIEELLNPENYKDTNLEDYIKVVITNEEDVISPLSRIRTVYPNTLKLEIVNSKTAINVNELNNIDRLKEKGELELFKEFYQYQYNIALPENECKIIENIINSLNSFDETNDSNEDIPKVIKKDDIKLEIDMLDPLKNDNIEEDNKYLNNDNLVIESKEIIGFDTLFQDNDSSETNESEINMIAEEESDSSIDDLLGLF